MANPYSLDYLKSLIGQEETQRLEFKSSRQLCEQNKWVKFVSDKLVATVSAFLNTDGGQLIVGIEENDGVAIDLSEGVTRSQLRWEQLQSAICDRIQPAVAGYISVYAVQVGDNDKGEKIYAFIVEVKPGVTAYQADDKRYYVRRAGQNEAMEDKDVRLRMLAADKPRLAINLFSRLVMNQGHLARHVQFASWILRFENTGVRNIPHAIIHTKLELEGLSEVGARTVTSWVQEYRKTDFPIEGTDEAALLPGQQFELPVLKVSSLTFNECDDLNAVQMIADFRVYIDDGLPVELLNYDLMADLREVIASNWVMGPAEQSNG